MKRGHAEALMPLIARVMKASGVAFAALDRIAATTGPGSFTGLRVGLSAARGIALAAGKPVVGVTTLTAFAAPIVSENGGPHPVLAAIDARHDHVYFQVIGGDGSSLIKPKVAPIAEALDAARFGAPYLVGNAAQILADRWPADARRPSRSISRQRPISPGWRGWVPPSIPRAHRHGPIICARPMPSRQRIRCPAQHSRRHRDDMAFRLVERRHGRDRTGQPARRGASGATAWRIVSPRLGRRRIRGHADRAQYARSPAQTWTQDHRLCGVAHGGRRGGVIVDRHRCEPNAAAACRATCC